MIKYKILLIWFALALCLGHLKSQTITTAVVAQTSCVSGISVPVVVSNCNGVGAISLKLNYNNSHLTFDAYQNAHPALSGGLLIINANGGQVAISWARTTAANIGNDTLVWLNFIANTGTSTLSWDTQTPGSCEYSNVSGNVLPSSYTNGNVTLHQLPQFNTQPVDKTVLNGHSTSFGISASGTGLSYRWQLSTDGGNTFSNLSNTAPYSGTTTATLNISSASLAMNGYKYRCQLTGTCPPVLLSDTTTLAVIEPVVTSLTSFSTCPDTVLVPVNVTNFTDIGAFSLALDFNGNMLTYVGFQNLNSSLASGNFVSNNTSSRVYLSWASLTPVTFGNGTIVELLFATTTGTSALTWDTQTPGNCEYTNGSGEIYSSLYQNGSITTHLVPYFTSHPVNKTIAMSQSTTFGVTAAGTGLAYRWQVSTDGGITYTDLSNGGHYSGVTTGTLTVSNAALGLNGNKYRCRISGTCPPVAFSNPATLSVLTNIFTTCQSFTTCPGDIVVALTISEFIDIAALSLALSYNTSVLTYTGYQNLHPNLAGGMFTANAAGGKVFMSWSHTQEASIPNNATLIELTFSSLPGTSALTWDTQTPGHCEYSMLDGQIVYSTWTNGSVTLRQPPIVTTHPVDKSIYGGGSTNFTVAATGHGLAYQWQLSTDGGTTWQNLTNAAPYSGVTTTNLSVNPAVESMNGYKYRCFVSGTCTPYDYSNPATLTVTTTAILTHVINTNYSCAGTVSVPIHVTHCNNVGGISLVLNYDPAKLTYLGYHALHPQLNGGMLIVNNTGNKVYISWASTTPAYIANGTLLRLRFTATVGTSTTISWDTQTQGNCEYSDPLGNVITSLYYNGNVNINNNYPVYDETAVAEICVGETFIFGTQVLTNAGVYTEVFQTVQGCDSVVTLTLTVNPLPVLTCPADTSVCVNQVPYPLQGALPVGGIYGGTGVDTGYFNPALADIGHHQLFYTYTDGKQCSNTCSFNMLVKDLPVLSCPPDFNISMDALPLDLVGGQPGGGTYSGNGVTANVFFPSTVPLGYNTLSYTYQDPITHCYNTCHFTAYVYDPSMVVCMGDMAVCIDGGPFLLTQGMPAGGTYTGNGVMFGYFDPSVAGPGPHTIIYDYDDGSIIGQCSFTVTVTVPFESTESASLCQGDSVLWRGQFYASQGVYYDSLVAVVGGCDSVYVLHLSVNPTYEFTQSQAICQGESFNWRGHTYTTQGTYYDSLTTIHNCDSVYVLHLTVNQVYEFSQTQSICLGEIYSWRGNTYTLAGTYYDSLQSVHGCDSAYILNLTVNATYEFSQSGVVCQGDIFTWRGNDYTQQGTYYDSLTTVLGCDSVYVLHLTVNPVFEFVQTEAICQGESFNWRGNTYTIQGTYYDSLTTVHNCDSVYVLHLTVNPVFEFAQNHTICLGEIYTWRGNTYTVTGTYYDSLQSVHGCDSVYVLNLTVNATYEFSQSGVICQGDIFTWRGNDYTEQGSYYDSLTTVLGCDSVYILHLTVNPVYEFLQNEAICQGESFNWRGNNYTTQGTYYDSLTTVHNCDSVYVLHLIVNPVYEFSQADTICLGEIYNWRGNTYTLAGTYYDSLQTALGCDSVYVLYLNFNDLPLVSLNGLDTFYCVYHDVAVMSGLPAGGTFSGQGVNSNEFNPSLAGIGTWPVVYSYTDGNGCNNSDTVWVEVDACVGVAAHQSQKIHLYPNPNDGSFKIELQNESHITVYNSLGGIVYKGLFEKGTHSLDLDYLADGVYFLKTESVGVVKTLKVLINK